jgi:gliding motility-associated-like protein
MMPLKPALAVLLSFLLWLQQSANAQPCTELGQTPSTAFPVCGISTFTQANVPICATNNVFVPGCSGSGNAAYQNKNPYFYKFTCYQSGVLTFVITPLSIGEDYDWQLYDITGKDPNAIFTDNSLVVTGNWSGTFGLTGASSTGVNFIQCASNPNDNLPTFARSPSIAQGHQYLLMVSHYSDSQSGYSLAFNTAGSGGTAVITDPTLPHMKEAEANCDGRQIVVKLNKRMKCSSISANGSEFSISPSAGVGAITSVTVNQCSSGFDFDELTITMATPLPTNNYQLVINSGTDGNSILDHCDRSIPDGESIPFAYSIPQPIFADSIGQTGCAPDRIKIYFPKKINCSTVTATDFLVNGPHPVSVLSAQGEDCENGQTKVIVVQFSSPVFLKGNYQLTLRAGSDGTTVIDECGIESPQHSLPFVVLADTVSADFTYTVQMDCRTDALSFLHNGDHDVNEWHWTFNGTVHASTPSYSVTWPASSTNTVQLIVSNGVCSDTVQRSIVLDNEVKAGFTMPDVICPEDALKVTNQSSGLIDSWTWSFDIAGTSTAKDPPPVQFPGTNIETFYTIKQYVANNAMGCLDSIQKRLRVLSNCYIAVPTGFTPNGDGLNDYLYPNNAVKARDLKFRVYNRWGQLVFSSTSWQNKWDGRINGVPQASGVYVWMLEYNLEADPAKKIFQKGTTTLIR